MNARDIQRRIIAERYAASFTIPNFTPRDWWEMDVCEITKAGYLREYEIKLTRSDFRADFKKEKRGYEPVPEALTQAWHERHQRVTHHKHTNLLNRERCCPSQFWYVTPAGLVKPDEVPEWAGLIWTTANESMIGHNMHFVILNEQKAAPRLHRNKVDQSVREHAEATCYWRWIRLFINGKYKTTNN